MLLCCKKGNTFQGPRAGSCPILRNELSEETYMLTKQEPLLGKYAWTENSSIRETRRAALPRGSQFLVLW